jgi:tRNA (guanine37-N1)-methyltransferase
MIRFDILTLFPQMFESPLGESLLKRARERGLVEVNLRNIRDFSQGPHRVVDDTPYGGGGGMVMKAEPMVRAIESIREPHPSARVVLMTPQGAVLDDRHVRRLAQSPHLVLVCGRYEGVDERVRSGFVDEELSIGDYVLTGGELAAMVTIDAVSRHVEGVLGHENAAREDSFAEGLLEYPQYTKPRTFRGLKVPDVLLSGNHQAIEEWRRKASIQKTWQRRRDLLEKANLSPEELLIVEKWDREGKPP